MTYLKKMTENDEYNQSTIMENYEQEFEKTETLSKMLTQMILDYKLRLQAKLTQIYSQQKQKINEHMKEIGKKSEETKEILEKVEEVKAEIELVKENEQQFFKIRMEEYYQGDQGEQTFMNNNFNMGASMQDN